MSKLNVNIISESVISALGFGFENNFKALSNNQSGVKKVCFDELDNIVIPVAKIDNHEFFDFQKKIKNPGNYTKFEKLMILSASEALSKTDVDPSSKDTIIIISTTKGNVDLIHDPSHREKLSLWYSADKIGEYFQAANRPFIISNACISGVLAMVHAARLLSGNIYKHAIVIGADILSDFVVSGFNSFKSLSPGVCKPFDANRDGLNIGEGAATVVLSSLISGEYKITAGASANDANHISGPSRTGEGLFQAISHVLNNTDNIDYISAHGTATPYNDDMESIAISRNGLSDIAVNSYKAYIGHTLGAAGIIESIYSLWSMKNDLLIKSLGCDEPGVVEPLNVIFNNTSKKIIRTLKLASGFGGCNAALIIEKND